MAGRYSRVAGRYSEVVGRDSEVAGRDSEVAGRFSEVTGRYSEVAGRYSEVTGRSMHVAGHEFRLDAQQLWLAGRPLRWTALPSRLAAPCSRFAARGYATANINYRLASVPLNVHDPILSDDVTAALDYVAVHGNEYHVASAKFAVVGHSNGAHLALLAAYKYNGRSFRFLVNGQTAEVQGERPYSAWKIAFAVLAVAIVVAGAVYLNNPEAFGLPRPDWLR